MGSLNLSAYRHSSKPIIGFESGSVVCSHREHYIKTGNYEFVVKIGDTIVEVVNLITTKQTLHFHDIHHSFQYNNRLILTSGCEIFELIFKQSGKYEFVKITELTKPFIVWDGLITKWTATKCLMVVFPSPGECKIVPLDSISGNIVQAKYDKYVLSVIERDNRTQQYTRYMMRFDPKTWEYSLIQRQLDGFYPPNFTVLNNGIVLLINEDYDLEIMTNSSGSYESKMIESPFIEKYKPMLGNCGDIPVVYTETSVYKLKMLKGA